MIISHLNIDNYKCIKFKVAYLSPTFYHHLTSRHKLHCMSLALNCLQEYFEQRKALTFFCHSRLLNATFLCNILIHLGNPTKNSFDLMMPSLILILQGSIYIYLRIACGPLSLLRPLLKNGEYYLYKKLYFKRSSDIPFYNYITPANFISN